MASVFRSARVCRARRREIAAFQRGASRIGRGRQPRLRRLISARHANRGRTEVRFGLLGNRARGRVVPQRISARIALKPAQRKALAWLSENGASELTRDAYERLTGMSRSQAAYDLADLVTAGLLERVGGGRSTRYRVVERAAPNPTQRRWTSERIRHELERFCAGWKTWPTAREFKRAGRTDLYVATSRYGGIEFWATELGLARGRSVSVPGTPLAGIRRWSWAASGAAAGALVVGAAVAILQPRASGRSDVRANPVTIVERRVAPGTHASSRVRAPRRRNEPAPAIATARRPRRPPRASETPSATRTTPVASLHRVPQASSRSEPISRVVTKSANPPPAAPIPLPAPSGSTSPPAPLPSP